ncbi:TPA: hypothetical protein ACKQD4_006070 [Pseudomonas aeruginosa]
MFSQVVCLYRCAGRPEILGGSFSYKGRYDEVLARVVEDCKELPPHYGRFLDVNCSEQDGCSFTFKLPSSEHGKFFADVPALVNGGTSMNKGVFPSNVYVVDIDWADSDTDERDCIASLRKICRLVHLLTELAIGVDRETNRGFFNLFFALPQDGVKPPRSFLISTKITSDMIGVKLNHLELLEQILHPKTANKAHLLERMMMFRLSIADTLDSAASLGEPLSIVVKEWGAILSQYRINLQSYVHGFSFEKVRQEVARAELKYAKSLSAILGDIAGKLLALPVSLAGLILLNKSDDLLEAWVLSLGLLIVSYILLSTINNQKLQVVRLKHSFDMVFEGFESRKHTYPKKIQALLAETITQLNGQVQSLRDTFYLLSQISWVPVWGVVIICTSKLVLFLLSQP